MGVIDKLEDVLRPGQDADEARRLFELAPLARRRGRLPMFGPHALGRLDTGAEQALHGAVLAQRRRVGKIEMGVLENAMAIELERKALHRDGLAAEDTIEKRLQRLAALRPHLHGGAAQRPRVLHAQDRNEGVIVDPGPSGAPGDEHRLGGMKREIDQRSQRGGPGIGGAQGRGLPVEGSHAPGHFAAAEEKRGRTPIR